MKKIWIIMVLTALLTLCGCAGKNAPAESMPPQQEARDAVTPVREDEDLAIEAGDVTLRYPAMWEDRLTVEEGQDRTAFYATIDDHDPVLLFEIAFGIDADVVGTIGDTTVSVIPQEPAFDDSWTEGEIAAYHAMQEDVNYVLEHLQADYGLEFN